MDNIYYLDLVTLLKTLVNISAVLTAELPEGFPGYPEACKGYVRVQNGVITATAIVTNEKVLFDGMQALQVLQHHKAWHVAFAPDLLDTTHGSLPASSSAPDGQRYPTPMKKPDQISPPPLVQYAPETGPMILQSQLQSEYSPITRTGPLSGPLSSHDPSLPFLPELGVNTSPLHPTMPTSLPEETVHIPDHQIFEQRDPLTLTLLSGYSSRQRLLLRTVYSKINGQRHVGELKEDLRLPSATVEQVLLELVHIGVIG